MDTSVEQVIRDYLPQILHMSLGTSKDNRPWVCEVHFVYDNNLNLYFRSLASRRHSQEVADDPNVAGNIVRQHTLGEYPLGVYFEGTARVLQPGDEQNKIAGLFRDRLGISHDIVAESQREDGHKFYKISVDNWYIFGKLDGQSGQKYKLKWDRDKHA